jgi:transcription elongation factor GreA
LANVVVVKSTHQHAKAAIGSTVHVKPKGRGKKQIFSIVGEFEADPLKGKVSAVSPLGSALMHKKKGDEATVNTPSGTVTYVIEDIS